MPFKLWSGLGYICPLCKAFFPPDIIFGNRVVLRQVRCYRLYFIMVAHCDILTVDFYIVSIFSNSISAKIPCKDALTTSGVYGSIADIECLEMFVHSSGSLYKRSICSANFAVSSAKRK